MRLTDRIVSIGSFSVSLMITNDSYETESGKKVRKSNNSWFKLYRQNVELNMSRYLSLSIYNSDLDDDDIPRTQTAMFSVFDLYRLRMAMMEVLAVLYDEKSFVYTQDVDSGVSYLHYTEEAKKNAKRIVTATTGHQVMLSPVRVYEKNKDQYVPAVRITINDKLHKVELTLERFHGITETISGLDLIQASHTLLTTYATNAALNKQFGQQMVKEDEDE